MNIDWSLLVTKEMKDKRLNDYILKEVEQSISEKRAIADQVIIPLQDAVDIDDATDDDVLNLKKWKTYRVALSRLSTQEGYPTNFEWPDIPE